MWLTASAGVLHPVSNVQLGKGFITLYRHPTTFGHMDPDAPAQFNAFRRATVQRRSLSVMTGSRDDDAASSTFTACESALNAFEDVVVWGLSGDCDADCSSTACPSGCRSAIDDLVAGCKDCGQIWEVCSDPISDSALLDDDHELTVTTTAVFEITGGFNNDDPDSVFRSSYYSGCEAALEEEFAGLIVFENDDDYDDDSFTQSVRVDSRAFCISFSRLAPFRICPYFTGYSRSSVRLRKPLELHACRRRRSCQRSLHVHHFNESLGRRYGSCFLSESQGGFIHCI
jgi:hypothetical protein